MDQRVVPYLLGELTEAEQIQLEEEYFADEEKFEQLQAAQNDLLDAYARGRLTPEERERFEHHFLASPWQRDRVELAQALADYVDRAHPEETKAMSQAVAKRASWWQSFKDFLFPPTLFWRLAAVSAIALLLGGGWLLRDMARVSRELDRARAEQAASAQRDAKQQAELAEERNRAEQLARELERERQERARLENELSRSRPTPAPSVQSPTLLSFLLVPQMLRDRGSLKSLTLTPGVKTIELELSLNSPAAYQSFRVELQTAAGQPIKSWERLSVRRTGQGQTLAVRAPAASFEADDYLLKLSGLTRHGESEEIANYVFRVVKE